MKILLPNGTYFFIDKEDSKLVNLYKWGWNGRYVRTRIKSKTLYLHRLLLGASKGFEVDHINRNTLDNRRINIRIVTRKLNILNRGLNKNNKSGFRGVSRVGKKWTAHIVNNYKAFNLGIFRTKIEAAMEYNKAAIKYFGYNASLNSL